MEYTVDYFIKKFEAIPENMWITYAQYDALGRHCAFGWCTTDPYKNGAATKQGNALIQLFYKIRPKQDYYSGYVAQINNGEDPNYQQPTPKQRILAALYDIKKLQQPEESKEKVKTVYVAVPVTITEDIEIILS